VSEPSVQEIGRAIAGAVRRNRGDLVEDILSFSRILKGLGLNLTLSQVLDSCHSLQSIDVANKDDFYASLQANMVSRREDLKLFDETFDLFWGTQPAEPNEESESPEEEGPLLADLPAERAVEELLEHAVAEETGGNEKEGELPGYSQVEALRKKDFSRLDLEESQAVTKAILTIARKIATRVSRRKIKSPRGK
jgi:uncharacterized protein with von Willebrand factor type A (vWA) domain